MSEMKPYFGLHVYEALFGPCKELTPIKVDVQYNI